MEITLTNDRIRELERDLTRHKHLQVELEVRLDQARGDELKKRKADAWAQVSGWTREDLCLLYDVIREKVDQSNDPDGSYAAAERKASKYVHDVDEAD